MKLTLTLAALAAAGVSGQAFLGGQMLAPLGNLRTNDGGGPYNLSQLGAQVADVRAGLAARGNHTDKDIIDFLSQVECLEGLFDTWGTFGRGFVGGLEMGGPTPLGARKANLTYEIQMHLQEVALNEQGHALFTRQAGSTLPCPLIDFDGGFNKFMAAAYQLPANVTVKDKFGSDFDPFGSDENFLLCVTSLEELGATGNKGLVGILTNPVIADGVAGLATSATAQATVERMLLWQMRNRTVHPFGESVQQVFARISALRDSLDGPALIDQGLINTDPRFIYVPDSAVNIIPTAVNGLSFSRTPQMNINILTLGAPDGKGVFFPNGLNSAIRLPTGFADTAMGLDDFPSSPKLVYQSPVSALGDIPKPVTKDGPYNVSGETSLTQAFGTLDDGTAATRGLMMPDGSSAAPSAMMMSSQAPAMAMGAAMMAGSPMMMMSGPQSMGMAPMGSPMMAAAPMGASAAAGR